MRVKLESLSFFACHHFWPGTPDTPPNVTSSSPTACTYNYHSLHVEPLRRVRCDSEFGLKQIVRIFKMATSFWPWLRLPFYLSAGFVSLGGGALYYFQK